MIRLKLTLFLYLFFVLGFAQEKPNVLLIMVDDMNDWVGAFGGHSQAITPNMDKLASKGVMFKNAYCSAPLCNPSRTSMLTGYQPYTTGVYGNKEIFRKIKGFENTITLPQYFEKNGYKTAAAGKIFHNPRGLKPIPKEGSDPGSFQEEDKGGLGCQYPEERFTHGLDFKRAGVKGSKTRSFDWSGVNIADEKTHDWKSADKRIMISHFFWHVVYLDHIYHSMHRKNILIYLMKKILYYQK